MRHAILLGMLALGSCRRPGPSADPEAVRSTGDDRPTPSADPPVEPPAVVIHSAGHGAVVVHVEVARTEATRERGLMFRREMAEDRGMIFMFTRPEHQVFWMHNTILPLDMVFIRADRTILGVVKNATPETDAPREVPGDSLYVLEVNGGFADRHHIGAGDRVDLVGTPPAYE